jgi:hypothetical protein
MMETRPITVQTHVSGRRRMIALSESRREPTDRLAHVTDIGSLGRPAGVADSHG